MWDMSHNMLELNWYLTWIEIEIVALKLDISKLRKL